MNSLVKTLRELVEKHDYETVEIALRQAAEEHLSNMTFHQAHELLDQYFSADDPIVFISPSENGKHVKLELTVDDLWYFIDHQRPARDIQIEFVPYKTLKHYKRGTVLDMVLDRQQMHLDTLLSKKG